MSDFRMRIFEAGSAVPFDSVGKLHIDPSIPRFTRAHLVDELNAQFGHFTEATFRRYQEKGLVAAPAHERRWTTGRPGSAEGLWSEHQRKMLMAVLTLRARHEADGESALQLSN